MTTESKCPFMGALGSTATASTRSNRDWWPNQINLSILHRNSSLSNPMDEDFDYAEEFQKLDLDAVKKDIIEIMAAHRVPYAATLSIAHPDDFRDKIRKALDLHGFRFFLVHAPCPTGWKTEPAESVELVRLAVRSGVFPLYEVRNGVDYRINVEPDGTDPLEYYELQKRFAGQSFDIGAIKQAVRRRNERLKKLVAVQGLRQRPLLTSCSLNCTSVSASFSISGPSASRIAASQESTSSVFPQPDSGHSLASCFDRLASAFCQTAWLASIWLRSSLISDSH